MISCSFTSHIQSLENTYHKIIWDLKQTLCFKFLIILLCVHLARHSSSHCSWKCYWFGRRGRLMSGDEFFQFLGFLSFFFFWKSLFPLHLQMRILLASVFWIRCWFLFVCFSFGTCAVFFYAVLACRVSDEKWIVSIIRDPLTVTGMSLMRSLQWSLYAFLLTVGCNGPWWSTLLIVSFRSLYASCPECLLFYSAEHTF